jgi:DNA-directed RNA polymerase specialized sigma24 family protein
LDERQARLVELRFFGGLTSEEAADALQVSLATANRDWALARAWLFRRLKRAESAASEP